MPALTDGEEAAITGDEKPKEIPCFCYGAQKETGTDSMAQEPSW